MRPQEAMIPPLFDRDTPSFSRGVQDPSVTGKRAEYIIRVHQKDASMACPSPSRGLYLTYLIQVLILLSAAYSLVVGEYFLGFSAGIAFLLTMAPALVTKNTSLCLPWEINLLIILSLYLHVIGHVGDYYVLFAPYYDKLTHFLSSTTIALLAFFVAILAEHYGDIRLTDPAVLTFIMTLTLAAGATWEICEFIVDQVFGTNLQLGNTDTMADLIVDLAGAATVTIFAAIILARGEKNKLIRFFTDPSSDQDQDNPRSEPDN